MAQFEIVRHTGLSASQAWERLTDWERHGEHIPLTSIEMRGVIRSAVGEAFTARTAVGPLRFDDPMTVTYWQPPEGERPGLCRVVKEGRVVTGWAVLTVMPQGRVGSTISWREDAGFRAVGGLLNWPTRIGGRLVFGRVIDRLLQAR